MATDFLKQVQARLETAKARYNQIQRVRKELNDVSAVLASNIDAYQMILESHAKYGSVFENFADFMSKATQLQTRSDAMPEVVAESASATPSPVANESRQTESEGPFELKPVESNGGTARGDSVQAILEAVRKSGDKGMTAGEIHKHLKGIGIEKNLNTLYSTVYKLKKRQKLRHEGERYYSPLT
jgi:hypothetical protein